MFYKVFITSDPSPWLKANYTVEAPSPELAKAAGLAMATDDYGRREYRAEATVAENASSALPAEAASE